jgi:ketosteroid isomerase-like protein
MKNNQLQNTEIIKKMYRHFNSRDINSTLAAMHKDVDWPNGMEGELKKGMKQCGNIG